MIERESVKSVGAYLESQAEAMRQALAALIEIPSYRTQAEEGAPYGKGPAAALQEGMRLAQEQGLRTRLVENVMLEADLGEGGGTGAGRSLPFGRGAGGHGMDSAALCAYPPGGEALWPWHN